MLGRGGAGAGAGRTTWCWTERKKTTNEGGEGQWAVMIVRQACSRVGAALDVEEGRGSRAGAAREGSIW